MIVVVCVLGGLEENSYGKVVSGSCCMIVGFNVRGSGAHHKAMKATNNAMQFGQMLLWNTSQVKE